MRAVLLSDIKDLDDVTVVKIRGGGRFGIKPADFFFGSKLPRQDHLQRDDAIEAFLSGLIHIGERKISAGRMGESNSEGITSFLSSIGLKTMRLKTGTPPRLLKSSIDWEQTIIDLGDKNPTPFSHFTNNFFPKKKMTFRNQK